MAAIQLQSDHNKARNFHIRLAATWLLHTEEHRLFSKSGSFYL
uniref:CesA-2 n=1 Tax=Arundo donax TaxID=35708 RepID=A0A0A9GCC4_ARUDO